MNKLRSKDGKILLSNFLSLSTISVVGMLLPLITLPYILRTIDFDKYGTITIANSLIGYFTSIVDYSFSITGVRDISIHRNSIAQVNLIFSKVITIKMIFFILSFVIISLIVYTVPEFYQERLVFQITALGLLGRVLFADWFFQGVEDMQYIAIIKVSIQILFVVLVFVFIQEESDYWVYPLLVTLGAILGGIISQIIGYSRYQLQFMFLPIKLIRKTIVKNFPIFVNQFMPNLYNNSSTFLLTFFVSNDSIGIYAAIRKIVDILVVILRTLSRVFFPYINRKKEAFKHYRKGMILFTSFLILCVILGNEFIFWYLNVTYQNALIILILLCFSIFGYIFYDIYGLNYLIVNNKDRLVMKNSILTSVIGFIVAFPLIYYFGIMGAALSILLSRLIMGGGVYYFYLNIKSGK